MKDAIIHSVFRGNLVLAPCDRLVGKRQHDNGMGPIASAATADVVN